MGLINRFSYGKISDYCGLSISRGLADYIIQFDFLHLYIKGEKIGVAGSRIISLVMAQPYNEFDNERWVRGGLLVSSLVGSAVWLVVAAFQKMLMPPPD
jgi:hypothetical protein